MEFYRKRIKYLGSRVDVGMKLHLHKSELSNSDVTLHNANILRGFAFEIKSAFF